jgi:hypothetical protein
MSNLMTASNQWMSRPDDERFWTLAEMRAQCEWYAEHAREKHVDPKTVTFGTDGGSEVTLVGPQGGAARMGNYAFGQVSGLLKAPAGYLRTLPATVAADCLNSSLRKHGFERDSLQVLFHENGGLVARAVTSEKYSRIWNSDVVGSLEPLSTRGWRVPPARPTGSSDTRARAATEDDCLKNRLTGLGINPGDSISPAGLYASDKDMFAFMVNEDLPVDDGKGGALYRGFFVENSEVGDRAFKVTTFLYNAVCGNHIVWGAKEVREIKIIHVGGRVTSRARWELDRGLKAYAESSATDDTRRIQAARELILGETSEDVVQTLFARKVAPKAVLVDAYDAAATHEGDHGADPKSAWGMNAGLTRLSQESRYADRRVEMDRSAAKVLEAVW